MGSVNWDYRSERGADRVLRSASVSNLGPIPQEDRRDGLLYTCHGPMPLLQRNSTPDTGITEQASTTGGQQYID